MADKTHFESFVDHITSDDISEISKIRAERDYALHCLEREIAICSQTQAQNDALVKALEAIAEFCSGDMTSLGSIARLASIQNEARNALASVKDDRNVR